MMSRKK